MHFDRLVLAATKPEWVFLKQKLKLKKVQSDLTLHVSETHPGFGVLQTGLGLKRAESVFQSFLNEHTTASVLHIGTCGALSDKLKTGDLVIATHVLAWDENQNLKKLTCSASLSNLLATELQTQNLPFVLADFFSSATVLANADEKKALLIVCAAQAVEMENYSVLSLCQDKKISYASVRGVFDEAQDNLESMPPPCTESGDVSVVKLTQNLISAPQLIWQLPGFKRKLDLINKRLAVAIAAYLK